MNDVQLDKSTKQLIDHFRKDGLRGHDVALSLAALIYLRWADFQEAEMEAMAQFDEKEYEPALPAKMHWRTWHQLPPSDLSKFIKKYLHEIWNKIGESRDSLFETHLGWISDAESSLSRLSVDTLAHSVHWLADQPFETPIDRRKLLAVYDSILDWGSDASSGEFRTPAVLARVMVELAAPQAGERIYDPCFGTAGLLTASMDYIRSQRKENYIRPDEHILDVYGVEKSANAYMIGVVRLVLAGIDRPHLQPGSSLERTPPQALQKNGFDVVLSSPPIGSRIPPDGIDHFPVKTRDVSGLFVQHALSQLKNNGRAVLLVPEGLLFRSGAERHLREWLVNNHRVEAVVSLPPGILRPYTGVKTNLLVLRKGGSTHKIRMVDGAPYFDNKSRNSLLGIGLGAAAGALGMVFGGPLGAVIGGAGAAAIGGSLTSLVAAAAGASAGAAAASLATKKDKEGKTPLQKFVEEVRNREPSKHSWDVNRDDISDAEWDFSVRRRDQSGLFSTLESLREKAEILPLGKICEIIQGVSVSTASEDLVDQPPSDPIPYIRIKDIQNKQVSKAASWLSTKAQKSVQGKQRLRAGDILLSKSGTIGKAGLVRNGGVGGIASSGLFVIRVDQSKIDPHYLLAYLDSNECRAWFEDQSRGVTVQHLSTNALHQLLVPVPPIQIQQRIVGVYADKGVDALAYLAQLLVEGEKDLIAEWVSATLRKLPSDPNAIANPLDLIPIEELVMDSMNLRNEAAHGNLESTILEWFIAFEEALSTFLDIRGFPRGPELWSLLQASSYNLKGASDLISGDLPVAVKARSLNDLLLAWLKRACDELLMDVKPKLSANPTTIGVGELKGIELFFFNSGSMPLRRVGISSSWGGGTFDFIAANSTVTVPLKAEGPKSAGAFILEVRWHGTVLHGDRVEGSQELAFEVIEARTSEAVSLDFDLGSSPYIVGGAIRPDRRDVFLGREELLDQIRRLISQSGNVVLLEGNRRAGKSSILRQLEGNNFIPGWLCVYYSFQGADGSDEGEGVPTAVIFRKMAYSIARGVYRLGLDTPLPDGNSKKASDRSISITNACKQGISTESPFSDFEEYLETILDLLGEQNTGIVLMLDEFDKLQVGIDNGITSPQVPENIRYLVQTLPRISAILTGSSILKRLREEYWSALYGFGTHISVSAISEEAAHRLIVDPVKSKLTFSPESIERIIFLTARQPFLLQSLCNSIFNQAATLKLRSVNIDLVNQAADKLLDKNGHFTDLWKYTGSDRRRFLLALCHHESEDSTEFRFGLIQEKLANHGVLITDDVLINDLERLLKLELIEKVDEKKGGYYRLAVPLMGHWIDKEKDFAILISEAKTETEDQNA